MERETGTLLFSGPLFMGLSNMAGRGGGNPPFFIPFQKRGDTLDKPVFSPFHQLPQLV